MIIQESIIYVLYIYTLIFLFINIKPTLTTIFIFLIYVFTSTYYLIIDCNTKLIKNYTLKLFIIFFYSLICTAFFYIINKGWESYNDNMKFKLFLFLFPFIYLINIKLIEFVWNCNQLQIIKKGIKIFY